MAQAEIAKILVFDEQMDYILLLRDEVLTPFSAVIREPNIFEGVRKAMASLIGIKEKEQPYWWLMRTEVFSSADTIIHIFFGRVAMEELSAIEQLNPKTVIVPSKGGAPRMASRLSYLIPMALALGATDSKYWPKP